MSTYNSKFSGAEIDALLEKVASGQVGGASVSEKETLAKEIGATHKHTITLHMEMDGMIMKARGVTYSNSADPLTVDLICDFLRFIDGGYMDGYFGMSANGHILVGSVKWCLREGDLIIITSQRAELIDYIKEVDFTASATTPGTVGVLALGEPIPVSDVIADGATFTDDVTEL